jgi:hypothetical protein
MPCFEAGTMGTFGICRVGGRSKGLMRASVPRHSSANDEGWWLGGQVKRLTWYMRRTLMMGHTEVVHRTREALKKQAWRRDRRGWSAFKVGDGALNLVPRLAERARGPWPPGLEAKLEITKFGTLSGRLSLFGAVWPPTSAAPEGEPPIRWLHDPITGKDWPGADHYCFDIAYRHEHDRGDIKFVWELNRLQFLPPIAALAARYRDTGLEDRFWVILRSWISTNPPFRGPNWNSGIELALRAVSVVLAASMLGPDRLDTTRRAMLRDFLAAHGFWLARYPSLHSSANNHRIAEGLGLLTIGLVAPDLDGAETWLRSGERIIIEEIDRQICPDGVAREQSPSYAAFVAEMTALAFLIAEAFERPLAPLVRIRLGSIAGWLRMMMDGNGWVPRIGDDDDTRVLAQPPDEEPRYIASVVAAVAGILGRFELAPPARDVHLRDVVFRAPEAPATVEDGVHIFSGGYTVARDRIGERPLLLVFDHGPLGYLSIAAHAHADTLAIWLHVDDRPVLVDAGTYLYHSGGPWRDALRHTAVHNTLMVEETASSHMAGPFMWSHKAIGQLVDSARGRNWRVTARHDGYVKAFGVMHERMIKRCANGFAICDRLTDAVGQHHVSLSLLFHPDLCVTAEPGRVVATHGVEFVLEIEPPTGFVLEIVRGDEARRLGWYSPVFNRREPAAQLIIRGPLGGEWITTRFRLGRETTADLASMKSSSAIARAL